MTPIGAARAATIGATASGTDTGGGGGSGDEATAQMLARRGFPAETIESETSVTAVVAQVNERRHGGN